jgi:hypothetical protein
MRASAFIRRYPWKPWRSRSREREERGRLGKATLLRGPSSMRAVVTTARI